MEQADQNHIYEAHDGAKQMNVYPFDGNKMMFEIAIGQEPYRINISKYQAIQLMAVLEVQLKLT